MIKRQKPQAPSVSTSDFLILSAEINYQLSADEVDLQALLFLLLGDVDVEPYEQQALTVAMHCVALGYHRKRRKLGPLAIIHPLRVTATMTRLMRERPQLVELLCALLHDKEEDLILGKIPWERHERMQYQYDQLLERLSAADRAMLHERMPLLTREPGCSYYAYLDQLIQHARRMPDLLHVKLADRLDNTLDTHVQRLGDSRHDFYRIIFDKLFVPTDHEITFEGYHAPPRSDSGALLLQQFYKNIIFLSLLRRSQLDLIDETVAILFEALADASIHKAQVLVLELLSDHVRGIDRQRELLHRTIAYCLSGRLQTVTARRDDNTLDGSLTDLFSYAMEQGDKSKLAALFDQPERLTAIMLAFISVFTAFINDPDFYVHGIDDAGLHPIA